jgi:hypothetical protein
MQMARRLACKAFNDVFQWKQTSHRTLLDWLKGEIESSWPASHLEQAALLRVVSTASRAR